jgi:hypothetical protein
VHFIRLVAVVAVATALLSGCGTSSPWDASDEPALSAPDLVAQAKAAAAGARSVRVQGRLSSGGQLVSIDMHFAGVAGAAGVISMAGRTIELRRCKQDLYLKGSDAFYQSIGVRALPRQLKGKYLKVPATDPEVAGLAYFTDVKKVVTALLTTSGKVRQGRRVRINGAQALGIVDAGQGGRTLYVALDGEPFPLRLSAGSATRASGSIDFLEYNRPFKVAVPAAAGVVDIRVLTKAAS